MNGENKGPNDYDAAPAFGFGEFLLGVILGAIVGVMFGIFLGALAV